MELFVLLPLALLAWAVARSVRTRRIQKQQAERFQKLERRIDSLAMTVDEAMAELRRHRRPDSAGPATSPVPVAPRPPPAAQPPQPERTAAEPTSGPAARSETRAPPPRPEPTPAPPPPDGPGPGPGWELQLTSRWLVWLGAVTIALGSVFLVRYSIERGWLGPGVRIALGLALGLALMLGGEGLRRQPLQRAIAAVRADFVPPALTAAGLFAAFASVYAAYDLYHLLDPPLAFLGLALIAAIGVALALLQGPFIALLGMAGGFLTPALIESATPSAIDLFGYLLVLVVGSLAVVRYKAWWWLAWAALAGSALWLALWFGTAWRPGDALPLGSFILAFAGLFLLTLPREPDPAVTSWNPLAVDWLGPGPIARTAAAVAALFTLMLVRMDGYGGTSLGVLGLLAVGYLVIARRYAVFEPLAVIAALTVLAALFGWYLPANVSLPQPLYVIEGHAHGTAPGPIVPPELVPFLSVTGAFVAWFGLGGFVALWGAARPWFWAGLSATTPILLLAAAYWKIEAFEVHLTWAAAALALAAAEVAAAGRVGRYRDAPGLNLALGVYAAGVVAALSLAAAMALEQAWLTVVLALELPALAWLAGRLQLPALRKVALALAVIVLVRLVLNYRVLDYPLGAVPGLNWLLYGYGVPAAAFFIAARWFRRATDDLLVLVLETGALVFAVLLITLEIRSLVAGRLDSPNYDLLEQSLQSIAWLAVAYGLLLANRRHDRAMLRWGWRLLAALATLQVVLLQLVLDNPLWSRTEIGDMLGLDLLLLAYLVPAGFAFLFARRLPEATHRGLAVAAAVLGLVLVFTYLTLEVRHAFHGAILVGGRTTDAEWYSYSVVWLVYAGALLALGFYRSNARLRHAALAIVSIAVIKVFVWDMAELTGLYRAASFLGLGLCLVGIGYLYQRFVLPSPGAGEAGRQG
jgi:uncharacterized membrane protein